MKLLTEYLDNNSLEILKEDKADKKIFKIRGPFMVAEKENLNKRIYPKVILEREVNKFTTDKIKNRRSLGQLDHPDTPTVQLDKVSHLITSLKMDENVAIGEAEILDTPCGRIAQSLIESNIKLGVSSRGVGSVSGNKVGDNFKLVTVDLVADPSAPGAFVDGILENKEYIIGEDGDIVEVAINKLQESVDNNYEKKALLGYMLNFINDIKKKL